jgi:hypothetical protein
MTNIGFRMTALSNEIYRTPAPVNCKFSFLFGMHEVNFRSFSKSLRMKMKIIHNVEEKHADFIRG